MDNQTFQRIKDLINQHQQVGVLVGPNPTLDEMAAGLGMYLVLKTMGKDASIACPTDPVVGISSLVGIDKVQKSLSAAGNGDLTVSFPYRDGEIEKVSYTLDNGKLNIQVKAGPQGLNFQQSDVEFVRSASGNNAPSLLFMIGIPNPQMVASIFDINANPTTSVVNIDNRENNLKYGAVQNVSPRFSSISEEVADFVTLLEPQVELDIDTCQNLLTGVLYATKDFTAPNTSYLAFEMAGILMKKGAKRAMPTTTQPNVVANPQAYFPPQNMNNAQGQQAVQQSAAQPVGQMQPSFSNGQTQPFANASSQQPTQSFSNAQTQQQEFTPPAQNQPVQPLQQFNPAQSQSSQPVQQSSDNTAPADWLTPKVYKGSTVL